MDKDLFKAVLRDRGIPVAANVTLRAGDAIENPYGYPVFVKPARLGSSVGISKVAGADELEAAVALARRHDDKVLIEEFQPGSRGRVRRARQSRSGRLRGRRDRRARRLVRLRGEVRRRRHGARDPGAARRGDDREGPQPRGRVVRRHRLRGHGADRLLRPPRRRGRRQRAQHDPGLHRDERLREAVRRERRSRTRSFSIGSSSSRSSATSAAGCSSTRLERARRPAPRAARSPRRRAHRPARRR